MCFQGTLFDLFGSADRPCRSILGLPAILQSRKIKKIPGGHIRDSRPILRDQVCSFRLAFPEQLVFSLAAAIIAGSAYEAG